MIHRTRFLLPGAALLAVLALPPALSAQDSATGGGAAAPTPTRTGAPAAAGRAAPQDEGAPDEATVERASSRREILANLRAEEIRHRERLATINRLRELAQGQGQAEKLALLDKLEVKEGARYNAATTSSATRLGDTAAYKQTLMKLAKGRIRQKDELEHAAKANAPTLTPEERKARKEARDAKKAAERAAQPATTSQPKSDRKKKVDMVTPAGKSPTAPKVRHKKDAGSTAPGGDPAKPAEPAPAPAPAGETPKPSEPPAPAEGGTPRSGS